MNHEIDQKTLTALLMSTEIFIRIGDELSIPGSAPIDAQLDAVRKLLAIKVAAKELSLALKYEQLFQGGIRVAEASRHLADLLE